MTTLETLMPRGFEETADLMGLTPELLAHQVLSKFVASPPETFAIAWQMPKAGARDLSKNITSSSNAVGVSK